MERSDRSEASQLKLIMFERFADVTMNSCYGFFFCL